MYGGVINGKVQGIGDNNNNDGGPGDPSGDNNHIIHQVHKVVLLRQDTQTHKQTD